MITEIEGNNLLGKNVSQNLWGKLLFKVPLFSTQKTDKTMCPMKNDHSITF